MTKIILENFDTSYKVFYFFGYFNIQIAKVNYVEGKRKIEILVDTHSFDCYIDIFKCLFFENIITISKPIEDTVNKSNIEIYRGD